MAALEPGKGGWVMRRLWGRNRRGACASGLLGTFPGWRVGWPEAAPPGQMAGGWVLALGRTGNGVCWAGSVPGLEIG